MTLRGKLAARASEAGIAAAGAAAERTKAATQTAAYGYRGLRSVLDERDGPVTPELVLTGLVAAVRTDDREEDRSSRDIYRIAKSRRRKLGLLSLGAGPLRGVATQLVELYCETAILFDVAALRSVPLSDSEGAAHMLGIWGLVSDPAEATRVLDGSDGRSLMQILGGRIAAVAIPSSETGWTKRVVIEALFNARSILAAGKAATGKSDVKNVVFAGHHTKRLIRRAERQLGAKDQGAKDMRASTRDDRAPAPLLPSPGTQTRRLER